MKKLTVSLLTSLLVLGTSFAGPVMKSCKDKVVVAPEPFFKDQELQVDLFGSYSDFRSGSKYSDGFGGGLGVNYYFMKYVGIGVDGNVLDGGANGVWNTTGSLLLRYPIELTNLGIAPYAILGGGVQMDGTTSGTYHAGGGLEFRIIKQKLGLYTEGRYTWASQNNDSAQVRAGVRFVF